MVHGGGIFVKIGSLKGSEFRKAVCLQLLLRPGSVQVYSVEKEVVIPRSAHSSDAEGMSVGSSSPTHR